MLSVRGTYKGRLVGSIGHALVSVSRVQAPYKRRGGIVLTNNLICRRD